MSWFRSNKTSEIFDYGLLNADMHSHLLPGVDDGAGDTETSLQMIRGLMGLGFKKFITTPHILWEMYPNTKDNLSRRFDILKEEVVQAGIDVELQLAAEYFLDDNVKGLLQKKEPLLTIKDNLVLIEFSMASEPLDLKEILFEMQMQGYQPVIAHPERYAYHERNKDFFEDLRYAGYFFQLNIMSLAGAYGKSAHQLASYFIKNEFYELAGTDLHNPRHIEILQNSSINTELKQLFDSGKLMNAGL